MLIDVSAGIIVRGGQVLICRRADTDAGAGLWEFPGGKREPGETAAQCLIRELREELGVDVAVDGVFTSFTWPSGERDIHFTFLLASVQRGQPQCLEHQAVLWALPSELDQYTFCPADASILPSIREMLQAQDARYITLKEIGEGGTDAKATIPGPCKFSDCK